MADTKLGTGLQTLFAVFLGLMVTAFVGVGVFTFYPPPFDDFNQRIESLNRDEWAIRNSKAETDLTEADRARIQEISDEADRLRDESNAAGEDWGRRTSIILVILATMAMAISLLRAVQLPVISTGLLLGGVFTMIYGVGWIVFSDSSPMRFVVMTISLVITIALGYVRFVRNRSAAPDVGIGVAASGSGLAELERRVASLEKRLDGAASALGAE